MQVNQAVLNKYGYSKEEFLQMTVYDIRPDEEKKQIHQLLQSVKGNGRTATFNSRHRLKDGHIIDVEVTVTDIVYLGKAARMATIIDITEKEWLKNEKKIAEQTLKAVATAAREEERDYIGKELHDNINQILASIKLYLDMADSYKELREDMIKRCKENIKEAINEVRALSHILVSPNEDKFSLSDAIQQLVETYSVASSITIHLSLSDALEELPEDLKLNIYRVIQEQFTNVLKYAEASDVWLTLQRNGELTIHIEDNGKGFDTTRKREGIGLSNIRKRVEFYNGKMDVFSALGQGTALSVEIPLEPLRAAV